MEKKKDQENVSGSIKKEEIFKASEVLAILKNISDKIKILINGQRNWHKK